MLHRGNYLLSQRLIAFAICFLILFAGIGIPLLSIKIASLSYFTIFMMLGGGLLILSLLAYVILFFIDLNFKMKLFIAINSYIALFYVGAVVFATLFSKGIIDLSFIYQLFM